MNNIKKITIALISILIIIPLMWIGYIYFKLNSIYDKEEAKQINKKPGNYTTIEFQDVTDSNNQKKVSKIFAEELKNLLKIQNSS